MSIKERISFERIVAVAALIFTGLALFSSGYPVWVRYSAVGIGLLLALAWLLREVGRIGKAIKQRKFFPAKLSKDHEVRLGVFLDEINEHMSTTYVLSPFYVWHNCSNEFSGLVRMNYQYYSAVHTWLLDLKSMCDSSDARVLFLICSIAKAVSSAAILGKQVEEELQGLIRSSEVSQDKRGQIIKDWEKAKERYNGWLYRWQDLTREIDKVSGLCCTQHIQPLGLLESR